MYPRSLNFSLSLVFVFFFLLVAVLGSFSIERLSEFNRSSADVRDVWLPATRVIGDLNNFTSDFRAAEGRYLLSSASESAASKRELESLGHSVEQAQAAYEGLRRSPAASGLYARFKDGWIAYRRMVDRVLQLHEAGQTAEAVNLYRTASQASYDVVNDALDTVTRLNVTSANAASDEADAAYRNARGWISAAMVMAALLGMAALVYVKRFISRPLQQLAAGMRRLAGNDTDIEIRGAERIDEIGEMARALGIFRTNAIELMLSQRSLSQQASMLEEKLAQEQLLTQLQQDFLSMASHEFRTPLTVIDGQAQRLIKLGDRGEVDDTATRARKIRTAVLQITTVIDKLLNSARLIDSGAQLYFHPAEIDLRTVLAEVCQLHREIAPQARISQQLGTAILPVFGDAKLLSQLFGNLISNALKYSPDGSPIEVTAMVERGQVAITVRDQGMGIPDQDLADIFGRYKRGSNVSGIVGTGVGLYLVKIVADLHGGGVSVDSTEGRGSRFIVALPVSRSPVKSRVPEPLAARTGDS